MGKEQMRNILVVVIVGIMVGVLVSLVAPWQMVDWGTLKVGQAATITVSGEADTQVMNQRARFNAGVTALNDDKQAAIDEVNERMKVLIEAVKGFGIADKDVKTQSMNVYQMEEPVEEGGRTRSQAGQWRVSNDVEIILDDIRRASELVELLTRSGATNVYGPNFGVEDDASVEDELLSEALKNAREKAEQLARAEGRKVGEAVSIVEGVTNAPGIMRMEGLGGGGGAPLEPGSTQVSKSVTVTFELE